MASTTYPRLSHDEKLVFVRRMALAFLACWSIPLPEPRLIGELIATSVGEKVMFSIEPDRHHGLGGPFSSVREYLRAYIRSSFIALDKQQGIDEYKETYLERLRDYVDKRLDNIPAIVEDVPIVAMHSDMGPHNIIVSDRTPADIEAIIDWEFVASAPFASLERVFEMFFREPAENGFGPEYHRASELREAFWGAIPDWKMCVESKSTQVFLDWFRLGLFMKPEWRPKDLSEKEAQEYWRENIRVVEDILSKYQ